MAMPLEFNLYNEQSTIRRLLELSKLIMSQVSSSNNGGLV